VLVETPQRDEGGAGGVGRGAGLSCSGEGGSAQHLNCAALLTRVEETVETAMRVAGGRKEMERAAEMVAMGGDGGEW